MDNYLKSFRCPCLGDNDKPKSLMTLFGACLITDYLGNLSVSITDACERWKDDNYERLSGEQAEAIRKGLQSSPIALQFTLFWEALVDLYGQHVIRINRFHSDLYYQKYVTKRMELARRQPKPKPKDPYRKMENQLTYIGVR